LVIVLLSTTVWAQHEVLHDVKKEIVNQKDSTKMCIDEYNAIAGYFDYATFISTNQSKKNLLVLYNEIEERISKGLKLIAVMQPSEKEHRLSLLALSDVSVPQRSNDQQSEFLSLRKKGCVNFIRFHNTLLRLIDSDFNQNEIATPSVSLPDLKMPSGVAPDAIDSPELRKKYEIADIKNRSISWNRRIQTTLRRLYDTSTTRTYNYITFAYLQSPRADDELVELLNKYEYPEAEKAKIFRALNIPYKGFREWRTNDGLLTLMAKLISADKKEVKLEKEDGKKFTIEIAYLRKEDQDYIKRQLEPKPVTKTPTDKKEDKKAND
jgi:hypothetical protein